MTGPGVPAGPGFSSGWPTPSGCVWGWAWPVAGSPGTSTGWAPARAVAGALDGRDVRGDGVCALRCDGDGDGRMGDGVTVAGRDGAGRDGAGRDGAGRDGPTAGGT